MLNNWLLKKTRCTCSQFDNGLLDSYFFKLTLSSECLEFCFPGSRFRNHPFSVILLKYQPLSYQSFKHNSVHMATLNFTPKLSFEPTFVCSSLMVTTQKANVYSSLTLCFIVHMKMTLATLGQVINVFGFISTVINL